MRPPLGCRKGEHARADHHTGKSPAHNQNYHIRLFSKPLDRRMNGNSPPLGASLSEGAPATRSRFIVQTASQSIRHDQ